MRPRSIYSALSNASVAIVLLALATPAQAAFPGANGKIAFSRTFQVHVVNPDGSGVQALTSAGDPYSDANDPAWSPDGTKIAFSRSFEGSSPDIYVMNADGSGVTQLTSDPTTDRMPSWSPDGTKLVFSSFRDGPDYPANEELYVMNADGTGVSRLTFTPSPTWEENAAWSPDGTKIAFDRPDNSYLRDEDIYLMNADGTGLVNLTDDGTDTGEYAPAWSPDGTKIAFHSNRKDIYSLQLDSGELTNLTNTPALEESPAWSPDGTKIAFVRTPEYPNPPEPDLYTMNADGSGYAALTSGNGFDQAPDWQPLPGSSPAPTYEAPKLAAPIHASLVPVFRQCGTGANPTDGQHSPPLGTVACLPPLAQGVAHFGPQAKGTAWVAVIYGDTNTLNGDQADATLRFDVSDIRTAGGGDYDPNSSGPDGTLVTRLRYTDRANGPSGTSAGTATDLDFSVPFTCTPTSDPAVGSGCALDTSADAVNPGAVKENKTTVLQVFRLRLNDSGPNGVRGDGDDRLFASEGVYIP